jgi:hypothetical protein
MPSYQSHRLDLVVSLYYIRSPSKQCRGTVESEARKPVYPAFVWSPVVALDGKAHQDDREKWAIEA